MVPRGYFRHHTAVDGVQVHLAVEGVRDKAGIGAVDRDAGLVTARFNAQDVHDSGIITAVLRVGNA
jgi:hypothetical protein